MAGLVAIFPGLSVGHPTVLRVISLPLWALFTIGLGSPVLAFVGVLLAQLITRKGAKELEARSRREETMRNLRWAAEHAVGADQRMADLGVAQLVALLESDLLDDAEKVFVEAALTTVFRAPEAELDAIGEDAAVVQLVATDDGGPTDGVDVDVSSTTRRRDGGVSDD